MDDAQKIPQNPTPVPVAETPAVSDTSVPVGSIQKEQGSVVSPDVLKPTETVPEVTLDSEVKEAGVEVIGEIPEPKPHEIIKVNVQIPNTPSLQVVNPVPAPSIPVSHVKILKRQRINTDPTLGETWEEEIEIREDSKKAA